MSRENGQNLNGNAICVICPNLDQYSETFIRSHVERLPAHVDLLCSDSFLLCQPEGNRHLLPSWIRLATRGVDRFFNRDASVSDWLDRRALREYLNRRRVGAVLAEFGPVGVRVMDACSETKVPLIVHFHGYDAYDQRLLSTIGKQYLRLFRESAGVVAVSRDMEQQLMSLGAVPEKIHYNPYGVDLDRFSGADPASSPPVFITVGRFVDKKAPHLTLLAFKKVVESCPETRLVMIGDGVLWEACKRLASALGIAEKVEFPGPQSHTEVAAAMRRARAFVQHSVTTSYGDSEGTPVAVLEAGAAGLPVIASRHAGIKDVVVDGETGFLVDEGNVDAMSDHMLRLAHDPCLAKRLGQAARERIASHFSMENSIANLWSIVASAIENRIKD